MTIHSREIKLWRCIGDATFCWSNGLFCSSECALPGTSGFVGEVLIILGGLKVISFATIWHHISRGLNTYG